MTARTKERPAKPEAQGEYISATCAYTIGELRRRIKVSDRWLEEARAKGLTFSEVNGNGTEIVDGAELIQFLKDHPELLSGE